MRALIDEERIGVLWATHLIDEARSGDDVVILHRGRVLATGPSTASSPNTARRSRVAFAD